MDNIVNVEVNLLEAIWNASSVDRIMGGSPDIEQCLEATVLSDISDISNANTFRPVDWRMSIRFRNPQRIAMPLYKKLSGIYLRVSHGEKTHQYPSCPGF